MRNFFLTLTSLFILQTCCAESLLNQNKSSVYLTSSGNYSYDFRSSEDCLSDEQIKACAETQLINQKLLPLECSNQKIEILGVGGPNNGWEYANFRCN